MPSKAVHAATCDLEGIALIIFLLSVDSHHGQEDQPCMAIYRRQTPTTKSMSQNNLHFNLHLQIQVHLMSSVIMRSMNLI